MMDESNCKASLLKDEWKTLIRNSSAEADSKGKLAPAVLELAYQENWFKLLAPVKYGGLEKPLPEVVRLEEEISRLDGSLGWVITLCSGAGWFGGFLEPEIAAAIFSDPKVCLAGSGAATGTAELTSEGYLINGSWKYASGSPHATVFTANCIITQNNAPLTDGQQQLLVRPFIFYRKDVEIHPDWNYMGMKATGSYSFSVKNLMVTENRCFRIDAENAFIQSNLYQYPFLQLAETTIAANVSGMALHFLELAEIAFGQKMMSKKLSAKNSSQLNQTFCHAKNQLQQARTEFYVELDESWNRLNEDGFLQVSKRSLHLAKTALQTVDLLYPFCGMEAADAGSEINRVWRDIHTASLHTLLTFSV